ncbi:MAG: hypothetical protein WC802_00480 [Patescibacteria group bacterium]|jgi:hypothetical protein
MRMKKAYWALAVLVLSLFIIRPAFAQTFGNRLSGRILLQVEQHGEAWYIYPADEQRYYMGTASDAYNLMRSLGLGITDKDLATIPTSTEADRYSPIASRLSGRILLQVEQHGEAWYINPTNLKRYYMGTASDAYNLMRSLGLGITDKDLAVIPISSGASSSGSASGQSTTFMGAYRVDVTTYAGGVSQTGDGGYLMNGQTDDLNPFFPPEGFLAKTNSSGDIIWSKLFQSFEYTTDPMATPYGSEDGQEIIETFDGGVVAVGNLIGFTDDAYVEKKENWDDVYITKLDANGKHLWTKMIGDYGTDAVSQVFETSDHGIVVSLMVDELCNCSEPVDANKHYVLVKYDSAGVRQWVKKTSFMKSALYTDPFIIRETPDGFIMIGQAETPDNAGYLHSTVSTLAKTDKNLNVQWSKSLEAIPQSYANVTVNADGIPIIGYTDMHISAGDFQDVETTSDGGYITFGFFYSLITQGSYTTYIPSTKVMLAAAKFDKSGNLLWVKSLESGMEKKENQLSGAKTADGHYVIMLNSYLEGEKLDEYLSDPTKYLSVYLTSGAFLLQVDEDFNLYWSKTIASEDYIAPLDLQPTADGGVVIGGYYISPDVATVQFGQNVYYQDALLIKLDVNGNASGGGGWIADYSAFTSADVSPYVITTNLAVAIDDFVFQVDETPTPAVPAHAITVGDLIVPVVSLVVPDTGAPLAGVPTTAGAEPKTQAQITYDGVVAIEPTNAKSQAVHDDLMPILNDVFASQVKLRDNMGGYSLDYTFGRLVTQADVDEVQKSLEAIGYTTYDSGKGMLTMMKVGYTLSLTFSVYNQNRGTLGITF